MARLRAQPSAASGAALAPSAPASATPAIPPAGREARQITVRGLVQGVGFRPHVHRLALHHGLGGWVRNTAGDVRIVVEGPAESLTCFLDVLPRGLPPLARIDHLEVAIAAPAGMTAFTIAPSAAEGNPTRPVISPDVAICAACEAELADSGNRRHGYPFITCTDCGPRFTVIETMPYDRERTSMRAFAPCPECRAEYANPADRRHHSQTNSCAACGPRLWFRAAATVDAISDELTRAEGDPTGAAALDWAAALLAAGGIVAIRGLGGFHLAVDAGNEAAVARLRARKHREAKPFAVMVPTLAAATALGEISAAAAEALTSAARPIVLLPRRTDTPAGAEMPAGCGVIADAVAPGLAWLGVMLPSTPLHHLLLARMGRPLVMTSGNRSEEPIAIGNAEAVHRLDGIADGWLLHDREIVARYDDSVVRIAADGLLLLRRARGYAPLPLSLPVASPRPLLAVGAHLKHTFTLVHGRTAYVSQHIGDLDSLEALASFGAAYERFRALFHVDPEVAARDRHPGYRSSEIPAELGLAHVIDVQHHHAHIAAVLAEHGRTDRVVGLAFDGTGDGGDGTVWGGEVLVADLRDFRRVAHLRPAPLPGGDLAARMPWRAALGYLALEPARETAFALAFDSRAVAADHRAVASRQIARGINCPWASSMGRLFDAAAAVLGLRHVNHYEGQAAMELESAAGTRPAVPATFPIVAAAGGWQLDPLPLLAELGARAQAGESVEDLAAVFHESVAAAAADVASRIAAAEGIDTVALGGGVFQNARLLVAVTDRLERGGLRVLMPRLLSPNDGAISYGQAAVAAARLAAEA